MATFNPLEVITDPDALSATVKLTNETRAAGSEVFIDTTTTPRTIQLFIDGSNSLKEAGVTLKCLYSFLKDRWLADPNLIKFPFPMTPITDEQFEFYNGWNLDKVTTSGSASQTTPQLIRTGGWAVKKVDNNAVDVERWASVITLGTLGSLDQVYFQQVDSLLSDNTTNIVLTGQVNQAIQYYRDDDGDGVTAEASDYNYSQFMKVFVREWQKTYAAAALTDIGVTTLSYQAYRFPLTNTADSKLVTLGVSEAAASGNTKTITSASWDDPTDKITYTLGSAHGYSVGDVVEITGSSNTAYNGIYTITDVTSLTFKVAKTSDPGTFTGTASVSGHLYSNMNIKWNSVPETQTGFQSPATAYFTVVIDADVSGTQSPNPTAEQIYAFVQAQLRKATNINTSSATTGSKVGKVVPEKLRFVGDDLYTLGQASTYEGVYIADYNDADVNRLHFWGYGSNGVSGTIISSIARATNVVTVNTAGAHGFTTGDKVSITGVTGTASFVGVFTITVTDADTFTYAQTAADESGGVTGASYCYFVPPAITSIARASNVVTVNTTTNHGLATGDWVTISGTTSGGDSFNGSFLVTVSDADTFTYAQTGADESGGVAGTTLAAPAEFTNIQYPYTAILTLNFGDNLQDDADAIYRVFFTTSISPTGNNFGTKDAILVNKKTGGTMSGTITGSASVQLPYDYDGNTQRGNSQASDAPVTAVAIGLTTAQYVIATGTISRSISNSISLVAPLERNYEP